MLKDSSLCTETLTKNSVQEFHLWPVTRDFYDNDWFNVFINIPAGAAAQIARDSLLSRPYQGRRYGPSNYSTSNDYYATLLQLSWAGSGVGSALYGL